MPRFDKQLKSRIHDLKLKGLIDNDSILLPKINKPKQCDIHVVESFYYFNKGSLDGYCKYQCKCCEIEENKSKQ